MDPVLIALAGTIGGGILIKAIESGGISISIKRMKAIDPHYIRSLERANGYVPYTSCDDPFCLECFTGVQIDIEVKPRERIVDGYLVPVPRVVPDDAYAHTEVDPVTENVKIYWTWTDVFGKEKMVKSMTPKVEVKEIDNG